MFGGRESDADDWVTAYGFEAETLLLDGDRSVERSYFVGQLEGEGDAFARFPRHFVIDPDGIFTYSSTTISPEALVEAIETTLEK